MAGVIPDAAFEHLRDAKHPKVFTGSTPPGCRSVFPAMHTLPLRYDGSVYAKGKSAMQGMSCRSGIVDKVRLSSQYEFFVSPMTYPTRVQSVLSGVRFRMKLWMAQMMDTVLSVV